MGIGNSSEEYEDVIVQIPENEPVHDFQYCFNQETGKMFSLIEPIGIDIDDKKEEYKSEIDQQLNYKLTQQVDSHSQLAQQGGLRNCRFFNRWSIIQTRILRVLDKRLPEVYHFLEQVPTGCNYRYWMIPNRQMFGFSERQIYKRKYIIVPTKRTGEKSRHQNFFKSSTKLEQHLEIINLTDNDFVLLDDRLTTLLENLLFKICKNQKEKVDFGLKNLTVP